MSERQKADPELAVMAQVFKAVNTLSPEAACRVLEYVRCRKVREWADADRPTPNGVPISIPSVWTDPSGLSTTTITSTGNGGPAKATLG